jgi:hypothetical protein
MTGTLDNTFYTPPQGIERHGAIGNQARRRIYQPERSLVEDLLLGRKIAWNGGHLEVLLADLLERQLLESARGLLDEGRAFGSQADPGDSTGEADIPVCRPLLSSWGRFGRRGSLPHRGKGLLHLPQVGGSARSPGEIQAAAVPPLYLVLPLDRRAGLVYPGTGEVAEGEGMTEAEWLGCTDPRPMLEFLGGRASDRGLRLFACACVRRFWSSLVDQRSRKAVEVSELFADGLAREEDLLATSDAAWRVYYRVASSGTARVRQAAYGAAAATLRIPNPDNPDPSWKQGAAAAASTLVFRKNTEPLLQCHLLWDVMGNPFRPVTLDPAWRTPAVVSLAQTTYDERHLPAGTLDADRLAVLTDALEESGCDNADILSHLRGPGPHVRGCWAVDLLLGKG